MVGVKFTVYVEPRGKQRAIPVRRGRQISMVTPQETVDFENKIRVAAYDAMSRANLGGLLFGPLFADVQIFMPIPDSWPLWKKKMAESENIYHISKPDTDNILKSVYDAMNKVIYADDAIIADGTQSKKYSATPRIEIHIYEIEGGSFEIEDDCPFDDN